MDNSGKIRRITQTVLEINDTSFFWYVFLFITMVVINALSSGLLTRGGLSFGSVFIFLVCSGVVKVLYRIDAIMHRVHAMRTTMAEGRLAIHFIAYLLVKVEQLLQYVKAQILHSRSFILELPQLARQAFSWLLLVYIALLFVEELEKGWVSGHLYVNMNILFFFVILLGVVAFFMNRGEESVSPETYVIPIERREWSNYVFTAILGCGGGFLTYLKLQEFGWLGGGVALLSAVIISLFAIIVLKEDVYVS